VNVLTQEEDAHAMNAKTAIGVILKENANVIHMIFNIPISLRYAEIYILDISLIGCECSYEGSISQVCDKMTGACSCRKGITGYSCSRCDRGTTGNIPYCTPCGECYDDWANILTDIKSKNFIQYK